MSQKDIIQLKRSVSIEQVVELAATKPHAMKDMAIPIEQMRTSIDKLLKKNTNNMQTTLASLLDIKNNWTDN